MKAWTRVVVATLCGGCNRHVAKGEPVQVTEFAYQGGRSIRRVRCDHCAGPAPPDLPAFVERSNAITPSPLTKFHPVLPLGTPLADFRARQSGEREPGEEG